MAKFSVKKVLDRVFRQYGYELNKMQKRENDFNYQLLLQKHNPVIFDVGANQGQSIRRFKTIFQNPKIYSFEPTPELSVKLAEAFVQDKDVTVIPKAVSDKKGKVTFNMYDTKEAGVGNSIHHLNPNYAAKLLGTEEVEAITLGNYCIDKGISKIDILKIDVQGHEPEVLRGAEALLKNGGIQIIELEMMFDNTYDRSLTFLDIEQILQPFGFKLYAIPVVRRKGLGKLSWLDAVYVNEEIYNSNTVNGR
jgi:FkbM family methyltransferase